MDSYPYKDIDWKIVCQSKTSLDKITWWYYKEAKEYYLFVMSYEHNKIFILNALSGKYIKSMGGLGDKVGQFDELVDFCIYDDFLIIVEKGNHRVQIFSLPNLQFIGFVGELELTNPSCIEAIKLKKDNVEYCCLLIGDNLDNKPSRGKCFYKFIFELNKESIYDVICNRIEPENDEKILSITSIKYDPQYDNLYLVDNFAKNVKIFNFNCKLKNVILNDFFKGQPSNIQFIFEKENGLIFVGDFSRIDNFIHVFDRKMNFYMTLSSKKSLINSCYTLLNHNNNKILYSCDDNNCILANRLYKLSSDNKEANNNNTNKNSMIKEYGVIGMLGSAIAAAMFLKR